MEKETGAAVFVVPDAAAARRMIGLLAASPTMVPTIVPARTRLRFGVPGYLSIAAFTPVLLLSFLARQNPGLPPNALRYSNGYYKAATDVWSHFVDVSPEALVYLESKGFKLKTLTSAVILEPTEEKEPKE